jgi:hypothetical protein
LAWWPTSLSSRGFNESGAGELAAVSERPDELDRDAGQCLTLLLPSAGAVGKLTSSANKRGAGKGGFAVLWRAGRAWPAPPDRERWAADYREPRIEL